MRQAFYHILNTTVVSDPCLSIMLMRNLKKLEKTKALNKREVILGP